MQHRPATGNEDEADDGLKSETGEQADDRSLPRDPCEREPENSYEVDITEPELAGQGKGNQKRDPNDQKAGCGCPDESFRPVACHRVCDEEGCTADPQQRCQHVGEAVASDVNDGQADAYRGDEPECWQRERLGE